MEKVYDGKRNARLGTKLRPAVVSVKTKKRANEVEKIFQKNGWEYNIEQDKDKPEDITELEILLNPPQTKIVEQKIGRNDPCHCGSGKKYKKCCLKAS